MKKKYLCVVFFAAVAVTASLNFTQKENEVSLSDLVLSNVEALAETDEDFTKRTGCVAVRERETCTGKDGNLHSFAIRD